MYLQDRTKKILMVIGFFGILFISIFLIYFFFFYNNDNDGSFVDTTKDDSQVKNPGLKPSGNNGSGFTDYITQQDQGNTAVVNDKLNEYYNNVNKQNEIINNINKNNANINQDVSNVNNSNNNVILNAGNVQPLQDSSNNVANGGKTSSAISVGFKSLSTVAVNSGLISFNKNDGGIYKIDSKGNASLLTNDKFPGASDMTWSPTNDKAIIEFPDKSKIMYDFQKNKQYVLPKEWYDFSFQKDGNKIAFMIDSTDYNKRWLSVANPDGSNFSAIEPLGNNADKVDVMYSPNEQMIALSRTGDPIGTFRQQVLLIGLNHENFDALNIEGRGFHPIWSPKGDILIYDAYNAETNYNPNLWVVQASSDAIGKNQKSLEINTWVSKCSFDSKGAYLYCAVPNADLPQGTGIFPDQVDSSEIKDDIYQINVYTGFKKRIATPVPELSISNLFLSTDDSILYYKDKSTDITYSIKLK